MHHRGDAGAQAFDVAGVDAGNDRVTARKRRAVGARVRARGELALWIGHQTAAGAPHSPALRVACDWRRPGRARHGSSGGSWHNTSNAAARRCHAPAHGVRASRAGRAAPWGRARLFECCLPARCVAHASARMAQRPHRALHTFSPSHLSRPARGQPGRGRRRDAGAAPAGAMHRTVPLVHPVVGWRGPSNHTDVRQDGRDDTRTRSPAAQGQAGLGTPTEGLLVGRCGRKL